MKVVYCLADDRAYIDAVQRATLNTKEYGLQPTHGLFGSPEWWAQVRSGTLPTVTIRGVVAKVYMGSMNDWPEFSLREEDSGEESSWTRKVNDRSADRRYKVGARIEIDYVIQLFKKPLPVLGPESKCVLEIRIESPE